MANILHLKQENPKKQNKLKKVLPVVVVVLILAGALIAGLTMKSWQNAITPPPPMRVVGEAQNKAITGDLEGGQADIDKALGRQDLSDQDKYMLYYQKGTNFQNAGKNEEAMVNFKLAEGFNKTYSLYHSMGMVAEAMGDIAGAIAYYEKGMPLIRSATENPVASEDQAYLQYKIDELKKKQ